VKETSKSSRFDGEATAKKKVVRVAAVGDIHYGKTSAGTLTPLFAQLADQADVLLLAGDLTDFGLAEEARLLARELTAVVKIPTVAVLGNHDFQSGQENDVRQILADAGVRMLDGESCEVQGIGIAGVKGFAGGFGPRILKPWGEQAIKELVREAVDEALKLESALARLHSERRIALLHYAPIQATVEGEPPEIFPFLGCSRLEEPLTRYPVTVVFHGHAHHGRPAGCTANNVPVYNVSLTLLRQSFPDRPPFHIEAIPVAASAPEPAHSV
jgi:Icc-related predicted phosphoesterase